VVSIVTSAPTPLADAVQRRARACSRNRRGWMVSEFPSPTVRMPLGRSRRRECEVERRSRSDGEAPREDARDGRSVVQGCRRQSSAPPLRCERAAARRTRAGQVRRIAPGRPARPYRDRAPRGTGSPRENGDRTGGETSEARAPAGPGTNAGSRGTPGGQAPEVPWPLGAVHHGACTATAGRFAMMIARSIPH